MAMTTSAAGMPGADFVEKVLAAGPWL